MEFYTTGRNIPMVEDKETNFVYISKTLEGAHPEVFKNLTELMDELGIGCGILNYTKDFWARDYMPLQLSDKCFLKYSYYPDYLDNPRDRKYITNCKSACKKIGITYRETPIKIDGGNVMRCGEYLVMTDKVFAENGVRKYDNEFTCQLESTLQSKILFIPWHEIDEEFGHSDGFIQWCGGNRVLMTDHWMADEEEAEEIKKRLETVGFEVIPMQFKNPHKYSWAYTNFLRVGNKVIMPSFNKPADAEALRCIEHAMPDCIVRHLYMPDITKEGGALHCITWNIKRL